MKSDVNLYFDNLEDWQEEMRFLRKILLDCNLTEHFKWKTPCYCSNKKNIALIHIFKNYCALSFFKGSLLEDNDRILIQPTKNSQAGRQIRFSDLEEIIRYKSKIKAFIFEAIEIEKQGLNVKYKEVSDYDIPQALTTIFRSDKDFKKAFYALTPGRQKGYLLHFSKPKQTKTRLIRIQKNKQRIMDGFGLNDCTCGLSKRKPNCDGSHKLLTEKQP